MAVAGRHVYCPGIECGPALPVSLLVFELVLAGDHSKMTKDGNVFVGVELRASSNDLVAAAISLVALVTSHSAPRRNLPSLSPSRRREEGQ